ncbi:MAG: uroporphyrinogen-III C-methyltransferase [Halanaerobiales bacterium]
MAGKVLLTGAGPGDPELITLKAKRIIAESDVILYDRLANKELLQYADENTELYYVGKKAGDHHYTQQEINELLVKKAGEGKIVCRLKGGDPFVFGRGGEEASVLKREGIEFEIVPGISSVTAVPAYAGIPLTRRHLSSSFAVITGHEAADKKQSSINLEETAKTVDTLVILMGARKLRKITERLLAAGFGESTPVALISRGTGSFQKTLTGELANIASKVEKSNVKPPAIIIIGRVVSLRKELKWFENRSLFGKRVLVTRPRGQAQSFIEKLRREGARPVLAPMIEIKAPTDYFEMDKAINELDKYRWIIFTSVNGVKFFIKRLQQNGLDGRAFSGKLIAAIGSKTAEKLKEYGLMVDFVPDEYSTEGILHEIKEYARLNNYKIDKSSFLLPRADIATPALESGLKNMGAVVKNITAYQNKRVGLPEKINKMIFNNEIDLLTFTSSSTVDNFMKGIEEYKGNYKLNKLDIACIGPVTAATVEEYGLEVDIIAEKYNIDGLLKAIVDYYERNDI